VIAAIAAAHLALAAPAARAVAPVPPTHVQAATADYDYRRRRTVMTGAPLVMLTRADATLVCRKLVADSDEGGQIRHATCDGDVKLTRGERQVSCAHATYEAASGKVVCVGDPVLKDGASVIRCEELVYDLDADRVSLKQPKGTLVQRPGQELPAPRRRAP
jgi:lipopolysaccharide export system protein LptA